MKIEFHEQMKRIVTVSEMPAVCRIIRDFKDEDRKDFIEYAEMATRLVHEGSIRVLEMNAEIAKNCRVYNALGDNTETFDVWINFTSVVEGLPSAVIIGGIYLTDVWQIGPEDGNTYVRNHMYVRKFIETK